MYCTGTAGMTDKLLPDPIWRIVLSSFFFVTKTNFGSALFCFRGNWEGRRYLKPPKTFCYWIQVISGRIIIVKLCRKVFSGIVSQYYYISSTSEEKRNLCLCHVTKWRRRTNFRLLVVLKYQVYLFKNIQKIIYYYAESQYFAALSDWKFSQHRRRAKWSNGTGFSFRNSKYKIIFWGWLKRECTAQKYCNLEGTTLRQANAKGYINICGQFSKLQYFEV